MTPEQEPRVRVAGIIIEGEKVLLVSHRKDGAVYWLLPGGGVDYGESLEEALRREFLEELNIHVRVDDLAMLCDSIDPEGNRHVINICFYCRYLHGEMALGADERLAGFQYFSASEIKDILIHPPVNKKLIEFLAGKGDIQYLGKLWQKS